MGRGGQGVLGAGCGIDGPLLFLLVFHLINNRCHISVIFVFSLLCPCHPLVVAPTFIDSSWHGEPKHPGPRHQIIVQLAGTKATTAAWDAMS
jgi:hypothetical protein